MRDEQSKYLIVNASDITKQLYRFERVACCNDFYNIYHRREKVPASEIFAKYNVPEKYQKIIIKVSSPIFSKKEAEEYITGFPFEYETRHISEKDNKKKIRMNNSPIYHDESMFDDKIVFKTELDYTTFNNISHLLNEIHDNGYLESYVQSIKEFFNLSLDLELLFNSWQKTEDRGKALKLYMHEITSKSIIES